jgi:YVTN family beta-propeller protein
LPATDLPSIAVAVQPVNRLAQAVRNDVHWGLMVSNEIAIRDERWFLEPAWQESRRTTVPLGGPGEARGDPEWVTVSSSGEVAVTVGGVDQVALGDLDERSFAYLPTGRRPVRCCFGDGGKKLFVANQLDDSITVVNVEQYEVAHTIRLGAMPELTARDRGERLFFDARVSHDGWMSCHSCHVNGRTSGFLNDNFSDQSFGAPKRVLSLLGHGDTAPFAWNGSARRLEDQVRSSIEITMQSDDHYNDDQVSELAGYVRQLPPPPSLAAARGSELAGTVRAGQQLFHQLECPDCHRPPLFTTPQSRQVGVADELGNDTFNPPSLIGVSQRQRFFHDARYGTLRDVLAEGRHQLPRQLTDRELDQLLAFLNTL